MWKNLLPYFTNTNQLYRIGDWFLHSSKSSCMVGLIVLSCIWKSPNSYLFQSSPLHPSSIYVKTLSLLIQWYISTAVARCVVHTGETAMWVLLLPGFHKLYFDGSINITTNYAEFRGIIHDHRGGMVASYVG